MTPHPTQTEWGWGDGIGGGRGGRPPPLTGFPGFPARPVSLLLMFLFHAWQRGGGARLRRWTLQAKLPQDPSELHTRDAKNANNGMFPLAIVNCPCSNLPYEESGSGFLEGQPTHQGWGRIPPGGTPLKKKAGPSKGISQEYSVVSCQIHTHTSGPGPNHRPEEAAFWKNFSNFVQLWWIIFRKEDFYSFV